MKTLNIISLESLAVVATMALLALVEDDRIGSFDLDI
jgi:hypothetical protein